MQQELDSLGKIKRFPLPAKMLCWALCAACMAVIFWRYLSCLFSKVVRRRVSNRFYCKKKRAFCGIRRAWFLICAGVLHTMRKNENALCRFVRIRLCHNGRDTPDLRCRQSLQNSGLGNRHCRRAAWRTDPVCPAVCNKQSKKEKGCAN